MGYYDAARGPLHSGMQSLWGADYADNRQTFVTALNLNTYELSSEQKTMVQQRIRRPIFALIQHGHFDAARERLTSVAREMPQLFSLIGLHYLLGPYEERTPMAGELPESS